MHRALKLSKPCEGEMLFISHSSKDEDLAAGIVQHLVSLGVSCWIAPRDISPGEDWAESVLRAIDNARCLLLVATASSFLSGQVRREIERAADKGIPILSVVFDGAVIPDWLRYHVNEETLLFFNRRDMVDAALQIMLKLQKASIGSSVVLQSGKLFKKAKLLEHIHAVESCNLPFLFSDERRPVYVLWLRSGDGISMGLNALIRSSVERFCQEQGAVRVPMVVAGVLFVFDSLAVENAFEVAMKCGNALERYFASVVLKSVEKGISVIAGIGIAAGVAVSFSVFDFIDEISDVVNEARELAGASKNKFLVSADGCS